MVEIDSLNELQREAVCHKEGPCLVICISPKKRSHELTYFDFDATTQQVISKSKMRNKPIKTYHIFPSPSNIMHNLGIIILYNGNNN